jgi:hypothetical protein
MLQLPAPELSAPEQLSPVLALTFPLPVGVPPPLPVTVKAIATAWLTVEGFGVFEVIVVVLLVGFTVCAVAGDEVLPLKLLSPL